jgi:hypothetical protein
MAAEPLSGPGGVHDIARSIVAGGGRYSNDRIPQYYRTQRSFPAPNLRSTGLGALEENLVQDGPLRLVSEPLAAVV